MTHFRPMNSLAWLDMCGVDDPETRARYLAMEARYSGRPDPKPRVISQRALDAQPAKRAKAKYDRQIADAKAAAAAPLRGHDVEPNPDPAQPRLL